ncbi:GNAT family N-acetyltransferase [Cucumibacter marinus]|uniref:GNAT family N-acetyltransferase n=1 Tax=Cucumibacter marinus TaxID=1121252 RepID=UPI000419A39A|nr:GNAT family N-acetyltransferase [Cucumibacter marinus]
MPATAIAVRPFTRPDVPQLHDLMLALADFEGYDLAVTPDDIIKRGLGTSPQFEALVAHREGSDMLLGMAVTYLIPYTYSLKPTMVLKELYVTEEARGAGVGEALFNAVKARAAAGDCGQLIWTVVPWNEKAKLFYAKLGGRPEEQWQSWVCDAL